MMTKNNEYKNKKAKVSSINSTVTSVLDHNNPSSLSPAQKAELNTLNNLSDKAVRKKAKADPDCEPLN